MEIEAARFSLLDDSWLIDEHGEQLSDDEKQRFMQVLSERLDDVESAITAGTDGYYEAEYAYKMLVKVTDISTANKSKYKRYGHITFCEDVNVGCHTEEITKASYDVVRDALICEDAKNVQ